jgi:hypothetical protein
MSHQTAPTGAKYTIVLCRLRCWTVTLLADHWVLPHARVAQATNILDKSLHSSSAGGKGIQSALHWKQEHMPSSIDWTAYLITQQAYAVQQGY